MLACDAAEAIARDAYRYEAARGTRRYARVRSAATTTLGDRVGPGITGGPVRPRRLQVAFAVASGALTDRATVAGRTRATGVPTGGVLVIHADTVHGVTNPTGRSAVSVHVYSPPVASMAFHDEERRELWRGDVA